MHCPFCHKEIFFLVYKSHVAKHKRLLPDNQQENHVTLAPIKRYQESLEGVPRTYVHPKCGGATGMPEEIVRSYLANPFLYSGLTFCCGCKAYVPERELHWAETKEKLSDYMERLRAEARLPKTDSN